MNEPYELTPAGRARLEAALPGLRREVARRGLRRRAGRAVTVVCTLGTVAGLSWWMMPRSVPTDAPGSSIATSPGAPGQAVTAEAMPAAVQVTYVPTEPGILDRLAINDLEVQHLLTEANQPAGLIRVGGRTMWECELSRTAQSPDSGAAFEAEPDTDSR